jgi:HlyD family secretion protein
VEGKKTAKSAPKAPVNKPVFVWVVGADPYKPVKRAVRLGLQGEEFVEVVGGLKPGEKILMRSKSLKEEEEGGSDEEDEGGGGQ